MNAFVRVLVCAVFAGSGIAQKSSPAGTVADSDLAMRCDRAVLAGAPSFWGAALVAIDGKIVFAKGYGFADRFKVPLGPQSLFDLGTAAQQLAAIAAMRLAADGKLRLDDSVGKVLVDWPMERAALAMRDLLRHTSGLPAAMAWPGSSAANPKAAQAHFARVPLAGRIGAEFVYSPANANLLALLLEVASGQRYERVLQERVFKAAGMATATPLGQRADSKLVTSRRLPENERGEPADKAESNWSVRGARGVLASVLDVHALLGALVAGDLLGKEARDLVWQPLAGDGYTVASTPGNGASFVRVAGTCTGYRARWVVDPASRSWVVVLTEDYGATDAVETGLVAEAWQAAAQAAAAAANGGNAPGTPATGPAGESGAAWPKDQAARFAGSFTLPRGGGTFRIERTGDVLRLAGSGLQASARLSEGRWPPAGEDRLRACEDKGLALLGRVLADEPGVDRQGFATEAAGAAARAALRAFVQAHKTPRVQYIGTTLHGRSETWFRLVADGAEAVVCASWQDGSTWQKCGLSTAAPPFAVDLAWVRADVATATLANGVRIVVSIEGRGGGRNLLFEDASPGEDGLLDCPEIPAK